MRAYLQLLRLPNVFTAAADILLGFLFTHETLQPWPHFALLLAASICLYLAGMVLNDYFDREQDARERPFRPIPSGRVSVTAAKRLGLGLLAGGVLSACIATGLTADARPAVVATLLAATMVAYDSRLKHTWFGPLAMGGCRTLNVLLGMSLSDEPWQAINFVAAAGIGVYIVGVTIFARTEARASARAQLGLGLVVLLVGIALLSSLPEWATGREWPEIHVPPRWYLFWTLIGGLIGWRCLRAIVDPAPGQVQAAVRNCIFALVILDAATCLAVQDRIWALVILALLLPMTILGRWIYST
jgi:4-hydroxybenzoate polyprenyltransferase